MELGGSAQVLRNPGDADRVGLFELGQCASSLELNIEENGSRKPSAPLKATVLDSKESNQTHKHTVTLTVAVTFTQSHIDTPHTQNNTHPRAHTHTHTCTRVHKAYIKSKEKSIRVHLKFKRKISRTPLIFRENNRVN